MSGKGTDDADIIGAAAIAEKSVGRSLSRGDDDAPLLRPETISYFSGAKAAPPRRIGESWERISEEGLTDAYLPLHISCVALHHCGRRACCG
ncbi:MAG: hypothetical protein NTW87_01345 [Planctomycetota bacterium]|nr:hypothetical protein [Planctomycetota bacterium]